MDFGPWVQALVASGQAPLASAFFIGVLASLGPCPLTTNISALGYITREIAHPRQVLLTSLLYTLGRTLAYGGLGLAILTAGLQLSRISNSLQTVAEIALGPLLIGVGLVLLDVVHPAVRLGGRWMERGAERLAHGQGVGAFSLGALFALAFCPYSAALFFGVLMPLTFKSPAGVLLPVLYGVGTSAQVIVIGLPLALGLMRFAAGLGWLAAAERALRRVAAVTFVGAGGFMLWNWIAATWL